ncbi:MAG: hypothetical protein ACI92C_002675, partial [Neolewinella sp.]
KGDYLPLGVQTLQDVFRDHAVTGAKFNDYPSVVKIDPVNSGLTQRCAATRKGSGSSNIT